MSPQRILILYPSDGAGSGGTACAIYALSCLIVLQVLAHKYPKIKIRFDARCGLFAAIPHANPLTYNISFKLMHRLLECPFLLIFLKSDSMTTYKVTN
jgi:hypothetical protein